MITPVTDLDGSGDGPVVMGEERTGRGEGREELREELREVEREELREVEKEELREVDTAT